MGGEIDIQAEQQRLKSLTMRELHDEHVRVVGWRHSTSNRSTLTRRILWHRQHGPLPEAVVRRAREIAAQVLVKELPPPGWPGVAETSVREPARDSRLPMPGTLLSREFHGKPVTVTVGERDFEYEGERYASLSAVASKIVGSHINGFRWFRLGPREKRA